jgi:hypothetical protein
MSYYPVIRMKNKGEILASILRNFRNCFFFLHNTKDMKVVESIMNEGFIFESQLPHSTDRVNPMEPIEITYFLFQRKDYGAYTIIIAIPKSTYEAYSYFSNKLDISLEEIMTITDPYYGDNDELIFTISPMHILGYFNNKTLEFYLNRNWDPLFNNCKVKSFDNRTVRPERNSL